LFKNPKAQTFVVSYCFFSFQCNIDLSFGHETAVTFRLVEGSGPIALGGQQLVGE